MENINNQSENVVAFCGLFCDNCKRFKQNKCPGCLKNSKASWCKIRSCCMEKNISTCAECSEYNMVKQCAKYNNVFSNLIEFVSRTDRSLCIEKIQNEGRDSFILHMQNLGKMSLPKEKKK